MAADATNVNLALLHGIPMKTAETSLVSKDYQIQV